MKWILIKIISILVGKDIGTGKEVYRTEIIALENLLCIRSGERQFLKETDIDVSVAASVEENLTHTTLNHSHYSRKVVLILKME